ncbi:hypothetical protein LOK49_LG06G01472 [Camellia lanceoleosa]|uniref:Uncharacterized protein n=1 Tax=Camellia lanceoleosa TaxID=1840588 RepID=A0ACC0HFI2_9ERIC|nr:hypothetical protein LOK49_LG06G01472 [Camellia lanceoleosa]
MPPGQATKRRSTTSMSEANLVELPAASPVDAFASLSPVDASPSSQTVDIGRFEQFEHFMRQMQGNGSGYDSFDE